VLAEKEEVLEASISVLFVFGWINIKMHHMKVISIILKGFL